MYGKSFKLLTQNLSFIWIPESQGFFFFFFLRNGCSCTGFLDLYLLCVSVWLLRKRRNMEEGEFSSVVFTGNPLFVDFCDGCPSFTFSLSTLSLQSSLCLSSLKDSISSSHFTLSHQSSLIFSASQISLHSVSHLSSLDLLTSHITNVGNNLPATSLRPPLLLLTPASALSH